MEFKENKYLKEYNLYYHQFEDLYHQIALHAKISDSTLTILHSLVELGDGCLQRDICNLYHISKQTVNSSISKLVQSGIVYLEKGKGLDKHIYLTEQGKQFVDKKILPFLEMENEVLFELDPKEREELLFLTKKYVDLFQEKVEKYCKNDGSFV